MAKLDGIKLTKTEVSQELNVSEVLGVDVSNEPRIVQEFGQAVVDRIIDRTEGGKDVNGRAFKGYSTSYIDSEEFEEFNKSPSDVNMTLTGRMLDSVDFNQSGETVNVRVGDGGTETAKAFNHNTADTIKTKRQFFGINKGELKEIKRKFKSDIKRIKKSEEQNQEARETFTAATFINTVNTNDIFNDLLGDLFDES